MAKAKKHTEAPASLLQHPRETLALHGQDQAEGALRSAYASGRLPHAWLITGARGTGKATLAYRFARFILGSEGRDEAAMHRVVLGSHTDLLSIENEPGKDIGVDAVREVGQFLAHTPAEGEWRVVIVDSADAMNRQSANAILKTLEEPPTKSLIMLVSHNPGMLLPTIRSRCRVLPCLPLSQEDFGRVLTEHAPTCGERMARDYFLLSGGSPGVALFLLEQEALALYHAFLELFLAGKLDWLRAHALADSLSLKQDITRFEAWQHVLQYAFRQIIRAASGESIQELLDGETQVVHVLASLRPIPAWLTVWQEVNVLLQDVRRIHLDRKQVLLDIFGRL